MISALFVTIAVEAVVDLFFCRSHGKPQASVLVTGLFANILTQLGLWGILSLLPRPYLPVLISAEILIWVVEGAFFSLVLRNQLSVKEAMQLSFLRNLSSFVFGLLLPV